MIAGGEEMGAPRGLVCRGLHEADMRRLYVIQTKKLPCSSDSICYGRQKGADAGTPTVTPIDINLEDLAVVPHRPWAGSS